ncbi:MAG: hypothetical protein FWG87_14085 [Defluviitaleaceae bacterium]|nr:hypothetical protein [Defluviitaleaceae bacterium]
MKKKLRTICTLILTVVFAVSTLTSVAASAESEYDIDTDVIDDINSMTHAIIPDQIYFDLNEEIIDLSSLEKVSLDDIMGKHSSERSASDILADMHFEQIEINAIPPKTNASAESRSSSTTTRNINDPNLAYFLPFNTPTLGEITAPGQQRWFFTEVTQRCMFTTSLLMNYGTEFDLYVFKLNNNSLEPVDMSYSLNPRTIKFIADPGYYFLAAVGFSGTGVFEISAYNSTADLANGANGAMATATNLGTTNIFTRTGVIDNPYDLDFFKFTITTNRTATLAFTQPAGVNYVLYFIENGTSAYEISSSGFFNIPAGTHYIAVQSRYGAFNPTSTYSFSLFSVPQCPFNAPFPLVATTDGSNVLSSNNNGGNLHVNGTPLNFSWSHVTNNAPSSVTTQILTPMSNQEVFFKGSTVGLEDVVMPSFVFYHTSWYDFGGAISYPALALTITGTHFSVNRTGANAINYSLPYVTAIFDVDTGRVRDVNFNFFYLLGNVPKPIRTALQMRYFYDII